MTKSARKPSTSMRTTAERGARTIAEHGGRTSAGDGVFALRPGVDRGRRSQTAAESVYRLLREEGLFVGSTSGINVAAAVRVARDLGPGHTIVTVLCDGGAKYQSRLFNHEWLASKGLAAQAAPTRRDEPIHLENVLVA